MGRYAVTKSEDDTHKIWRCSFKIIGCIFCSFMASLDCIVLSFLFSYVVVLFLYFASVPRGRGARDGISVVILDCSF